MLTTAEVEQVGNAVKEKVEGIVAVSLKATDAELAKIRTELPDLITAKSKELTDERIDKLKTDLPGILDGVLKSERNGGATRTPFTLKWDEVKDSRHDKHERLTVPAPALIQRHHRANREGLSYMERAAIGGVDEGQDIPGGAVATTAPWYKRTAGDAFQAFARQLDAPAGTVKDVRLDTVEFRAEAHREPDADRVELSRVRFRGDRPVGTTFCRITSVWCSCRTRRKKTSPGPFPLSRKCLRMAWGKLRGAQSVAKRSRRRPQ